MTASSALNGNVFVIIITLVTICTLILFAAVYLYLKTQKNYDDRIIRLKEWIASDRGGEVLEFNSVRDRSVDNSSVQESKSVRFERSYISSTDSTGHNPSL